MTHVALVHDTITSLAMGRPPRPEPPPDWEDVLGWWDGQRLALREALGRDPEAPAFSPYPGFDVTVGDWTRRMAHETAIHRLDAESALPDPVRTRFSPEFANDGIDEFLTFVVPRRGFAIGVRITTPERMWTVGTPGTEVTGDADEVYRAVWGRPHRAAISGDQLPAV